MKKFALILAVSMMLCTLAGCGEKEDVSASEGQTNSTESTEGAGDTIAADGAGSEATESAQQTADVTSTASEEVSVPEEDVFVPIIEDEGEYKNGSWLFEAENSEGEIKNYLYNVAADEVIEFTPEDAIYDFSGFTIACWETDSRWNVVREYAKNIKTGEIYFDTDNDGAILVDKHDNYFVDNSLLVVQKETGFDNAGIFMGAVTGDGTWDYEMRADYQVPYHSEFEFPKCNGTCGWYYYGNGIIEGDRYNQIFEMDKNEYIDSQLFGDFDYLYVEYTSDEVIFVSTSTFWGDESLLGYDRNANKIFYKNSSIKNSECYNNFCLLTATDDPCTVCNMDTGEEITFPTADYSAVRPCAFAENAILFECNGADGNTYLCAINASGERIMEPTLKSELKYLCTISNDNFVLKMNDGKIRTIDTAAGVVTDTEVSYTDITVEKYSDIAVVELTHPETGGACYQLVDLKDPAKLIDPFEA